MVHRMRFQVMALVECINPTTPRLTLGATYYVLDISKTGKLKLEPRQGRRIKGWFGRKAFIVRYSAAEVKRFKPFM